MEAEFNTEEEIVFKHNQAELEEKIRNIIKDGIDTVQILADFDMTLTRDRVGGEKASSCFGALTHSGLLSDEYVEKNKKNYEKYRPIEKDPHLDLQEKEALMEEWWEKECDDIINEGPSHEDFMKMASSCKIYFRNGISELLEIRKDVPMLVVSAGIGEIIKASFEVLTNDIDTNLSSLKNFSIVSNLGVYEDSKIVAFNQPLVNVMNKSSHVKKFIDAQKELDEENHHHLRGNIIVMGDVIEDLRMIDEISYDNIIKVGFLNNLEVDSHLEEVYEKHFDIIIQHDGNLYPIISLLQLFAGEKMSHGDKLPDDFREFLESLYDD
ncbi:unnamed protein product [Moneuplotes crassus]|uniref:5'-nucleotidase n=2 Tax=Euplotes crassus TaxID=5936 RepID=A0AAD1XGH8_EUPCR|nr:unnamed protein product [Moneuplotes crassus]